LNNYCIENRGQIARGFFIDIIDWGCYTRRVSLVNKGKWIMEVHATFQEAVDAIVDGALSPGGDLRAGHGNPEVAAELVQTMCDNYLRQEREHGRETR